MKKVKLSLKHWLRMVRKRTFRNILSKKKNKDPQPKNKISTKGMTIIAPKVLSLSLRYHEVFVSFKNTLERLCFEANSSERQVRINFRETEVLSADACAVFIATIDTIRFSYPNLKFSIIRPKNKPNDYRIQNKMKYDVDAVFCHIGLYKLLGFNYTSSSSKQNVICWHYIQGNEADGSITKPLKDELENIGISTSGLYRTWIEGISNAVEHAYNTTIPTKRSFPLKRWWMLLAVLDNEMSIFVCDLGHGIPNTLEYTQEERFLSRLWKEVLKLATKPTNDCLYIKAAAAIKESRTELEYRGKGSTDIKSLIKENKGSVLFIHSNKGTYTFAHTGNERCYENKSSINGTIIQWNIPLNKA
ncbi:TPA: hypothetical protein ACPDW7_001852 [Pasteurella multocida]|uniref:hypothetical protein n=1 Tax=Pasteurella multocida TaxID=747 RepID=UPI0032F7F728|nr:hypothetical protein [Pasteurella multocida]HDR1432929.1 hypothetical protein [Pasteurella multocida]HDR1857136.1 hypothetical protein [Pasteurella multocida]HDR1897403.1 hypothetical protein [Pasteurella multocida]